MNTRFEQEARESLTAIDGQARAKRFAPMPVEPIGKCWSPVMTEQQKQEHDAYVTEHKLPF